MSFGRNEITTPFRREDGSLLVHKVFYTIQGEGPDQGRPAIFVRLAKCNLRCYFCDTEFEDGTDRSLASLSEEVLQIARIHHCSLVVITGGEPLLQNIVPFVKVMNNHGIACSVETAGTTFYPELMQVFNAVRSIHGNLIVCSPKTGRIAPELEIMVGAWKYIIKAGEQDEHGLPNVSTQRPGAPLRVFRPSWASVPVFVQAMDEYDPDKNAANLEAAKNTALRFGYNLGIQIHKIAGLE